MPALPASSTEPSGWKRLPGWLARWPACTLLPASDCARSSLNVRCASAKCPCSARQDPAVSRQELVALYHAHSRSTSQLMMIYPPHSPPSRLSRRILLSSGKRLAVSSIALSSITKYLYLPSESGLGSATLASADVKRTSARTRLVSSHFRSSQPFDISKLATGSSTFPGHGRNTSSSCKAGAA